jgi:hypothetical protein
MRKFKNSHIFVGIPNGSFNSINEIFNPNPTLLLKRINNNHYKIIHISDIPNICIMKLRKLRLKDNNNYFIHSNIKINSK